MSFQEDHNLFCKVLTGTASSGSLTLSCSITFNSFIRQITVYPTTVYGNEPTEFNFYVSDANGEVFRVNGVSPWFNTVINSEGEVQPAFILPAVGTLTFYIEESTRDELFTVRVYFN